MGSDPAAVALTAMPALSRPVRRTKDKDMPTIPVLAAPASADARRSDDERGRTYTIGDLAREFGVSLRTLRFYEDRGLLSPLRSGSTRIYDARQRARLELILKGKQLGFTLTEIRALLEREERGEGIPKLRLSVKQIDGQLVHLERQKAEIEGAIAELRAQRQKALSS
jgi:DNA-binding transcriptional MerR regulator